MKRIGVLALASIFAVNANAQSAKVVTAYRYMQDFNSSKDVESLNKAKEAIDLAHMRQLRGYTTVITPASPMRCQGRPSTRASNCGRVSASVLPSLGQTNRPAFSRRAANHTPMPSCTSAFMRLARRLANR